MKENKMQNLSKEKPMTSEKKIGTTTYVVNSFCCDFPEEVIKSKISRLIKNELSSV